MKNEKMNTKYLTSQDDLVKAEIIAHSVSAETNQPIITYVLEYPRLIHSEIMTHRTLSKNSASSRAIPVKTVVEMVRNKPARPVRFGKNMAGMQDAGEWNQPVKLHGSDLPLDPVDAWEYAAQLVADVAEAFDAAKYHKQVCNRLTEPFQFMK